MKNFNKTLLQRCCQVGIIAICSTSAPSVFAAEQDSEEIVGLEVIEVTARKRVENVQEIPVSVSALQGENLDAYASGAVDIRFLNAKIPSLSVESSYGRTFPRFYIRGLGNTDFDLNASQPVSYVVDEVVQENAILKGFPVFDVERVEVLRGPQGTLFGRNTPAGLVKLDSVKPSQEDANGYLSVSYGSKNTMDVKGAFGTALTDNLSARISLLHQDRDDYIDNLAPGNEQKDVLGGYTDQAARFQLLYEEGDFSALLNYHMRDLDGKPIVFYGNAIEQGTNDLVAGFDPDVVYHDSASRATQQVQTEGWSLKLEYDYGDYTLTSITASESAEIYSQGDVDGGYGCGLDFCSGPTGPGFIPLAFESGDAIPDHKQLTQELRISSNFSGDFNYQLGFFYFDEDLTILSIGFDAFNPPAQSAYAIQEQETQAWAVFGSFDYQFTDKFSVTTGIRYSDDQKDFVAERYFSAFDGPLAPVPIKTDDSHVSWDVSSSYKYSSDINLYARVANGFRAPSIQGRVAFSDAVTVADSETILSFETGIKSDVWDNRGRVNASVFYYTIDDQQVTAVGGNDNGNKLKNVDETIGYGFEFDSEFMVTENLTVTANFSYNKTEFNDDTLATDICAFGNCTVTDPLREDGKALLDGNSLPHAPELIYNITARYAREVGEGEFYVYTDWSYRDEINFFLYESLEYRGDSLLEGGLRSGYTWDSGDFTYEVAAFARNLTDEVQTIGAVDFNNRTGMVNEGRFVGAEFKVAFY
ncbi:TonB-dependent receptor [Thalassotalea sp. PLHSN55]|uniref:TonB-dependent receptor n=1 Tax=Thalassotalea sp. PLHSN55 TaxID=3435888 RepID=UPI003F861A0B